MRLPDALLKRVLDRLGLAQAPAADLEGLTNVYRAWCQRVPFDNVRKMIALRTEGAPLPGGDAGEFFENWLDGGTGGTCWPSSNALFELVNSLGFEARRVAGAMRDLGIVNHGSVKVTIEAREWLVDSSLLSNIPLPLESGVFVSQDPVFAVEVEAQDATHIVWADTPPNSSYLPCRLLEDNVGHAYYLARYEQTRASSPFNQRLYARRNLPGAMVVLLGRTRFSKTAAGIESRDLSPDELCEALHRDIGISGRVIDDWARSGSLAASFEPPAGPHPPPVIRTPPSQRQATGQRRSTRPTTSKA